MHAVLLAAQLGSTGKGGIETTVAVVGAVVVAALLVIGIVLAVARRGSPLTWLGLGAVSLVATVTVLSFV